jgi:hypothetical protein
VVATRNEVKESTDSDDVSTSCGVVLVCWSEPRDTVEGAVDEDSKQSSVTPPAAQSDFDSGPDVVTTHVGYLGGVIGSCFNHTGFANSAKSVLAEGSWYFGDSSVCGDSGRGEGGVREFRLHSKQCTLKRYEPDDVVSCFADKHIAFIGDSISRYQFGNMITYVETGLPTWPCHEVWQLNTVMQQRGMGGMCGNRVRCDTMGEFNRDNCYYHSPSLRVNVSFFCYFEAGYLRTPIGWYPSTVPFDKGYVYTHAQLPDIAVGLRSKNVSFDAVIVNSGSWPNKEFHTDLDTAIRPGKPRR